MRQRREREFNEHIAAYFKLTSDAERAAYLDADIKARGGDAKAVRSTAPAAGLGQRRRSQRQRGRTGRRTGRPGGQAGSGGGPGGQGGRPANLNDRGNRGKRRLDMTTAEQRAARRNISRT